ncbi:MAG: hypothetical protein AAB917_01800 [Patescibacteria group bacterium]
MIHYTLLPDDEIKKLRWEYRIRLSIILLFFVSCAMVIGTFSLIPSYILSDTQGIQAVKNAEELQKSRQARGIDQVEKELAQNQMLTRELNLENKEIMFSDIIQSISKHRSGQVTLSAFELSGFQTKSTTTISAVIQGKALTREALIAFKDSLENDSKFAGIELPISDLAKSKNINFAMRLIVLK